MYRFLAGIIITLIIVGIVQYCTYRNDQKQEINMNSALIQQQIQQVGKLIVTEGHFSQVLSYRNTKKNYLDIFSANKKALVIINAKVTIGYDLRKIKTQIDETNQVVQLTYIPEPEVNIYPDLEYYDVSQDYLNQFGAEDYNKIKDRVTQLIGEKIDQSDLRENAKGQLLGELSKIYILTHAMGWTLQYQEDTIRSYDELERLRF
ncbi:MAG: DUF4230 domain-containing protein [Cyclobacteriaceae bacterium]